MMPPWLTDDEIGDLCDGLVQSAAQARYLRALGLTVRAKPNGRPLVMRSDVEALGIKDPARPARRAEPNRFALISSLNRA